MQAITSRLPAKDEALKLFWFVLAVTNFLAFIAIFSTWESLLLRFRLAEIAGVCAYVLSSTLLESSFVLLLLALVGMILPANWLRAHFSLQGTLIYIVGTIFLLPWIGFTSRLGLNSLLVLTNYLTQKTLILGLWCFFWGLVAFLLTRIFSRPAPREKFGQFIERVGLLAMVYFALDCLGALVVIGRLLL